MRTVFAYATLFLWIAFVFIEWIVPYMPIIILTYAIGCGMSFYSAVRPLSYSSGKPSLVATYERNKLLKRFHAMLGNFAVIPLTCIEIVAVLSLAYVSSLFIHDWNHWVMAFMISLGVFHVITSLGNEYQRSIYKKCFGK